MPSANSSVPQLRPSERVMVSFVGFTTGGPEEPGLPCTMFIVNPTLVARMSLGLSSPLAAVRNIVPPLTDAMR